MEKKQVHLTPEMALQKMRKYCDYQERCHQDVRSKLLELQVYGSGLEETMSALIQEGYLNEERFAKAFVSGKFRIKRWGKNKIRQELKARHVSDYCIQSGLNQIDDEDYNRTIIYNIDKAISSGSKTKHDILQYTYRKGFEGDLVSEILKEKYSNTIKK